MFVTDAYPKIKRGLILLFSSHPSDFSPSEKIVLKKYFPTSTSGKREAGSTESGGPPYSLMEDGGGQRWKELHFSTF